MNGKEFKQIRNQLHLSQEEMAQVLHVSRSTVASYETDRRKIDQEILDELKALYPETVSAKQGRFAFVHDPISLLACILFIAKFLHDFFIGKEFLAPFVLYENLFFSLFSLCFLIVPLIQNKRTNAALLAFTVYSLQIINQEYLYISYYIYEIYNLRMLLIYSFQFCDIFICLFLLQYYEEKEKANNTIHTINSIVKYSLILYLIVQFVFRFIDSDITSQVKLYYLLLNTSQILLIFMSIQYGKNT